MSGNLKNSESNGQRGQTKTAEVAVSTTHKTQFRNRIFLFPFLFSKKRMWLDLMRREAKIEGDIRLGKPLLKPNLEILIMSFQTLKIVCLIKILRPPFCQSVSTQSIASTKALIKPFVSQD